ncbi:hypothetical protein AQ914_04465 [Burkholderia pseudomallei]|nr:hypothetical protein AQ914_04465 [Burkholderia pseudomallei]
MSSLLSLYGTSGAHAHASVKSSLSTQGDTQDTTVSGADNTLHGLFSGGDNMVNVILAVTEALQDSRQASVSEENTAISISYTASQNAASSIEQQGQEAMDGAITGSVLMGTMAFAGATQKFSALSDRETSLEDNIKTSSEMEQMTVEGGLQLNSLDSVDKNLLGESDIELESDTGESFSAKTLDADELRDKEVQSMSDEEPGRKAVTEAHERADKVVNIGAARKDLRGELLSKGGEIGKSMADGVTSMEQSNSKSAETVSENTSQVATNSASSIHETQQQTTDLIAQVIEAAMQVSSNNSAVAGQVASNLRA